MEQKFYPKMLDRCRRYRQCLICHLISLNYVSPFTSLLELQADCSVLILLLLRTLLKLAPLEVVHVPRIGSPSEMVQVMRMGAPL